jgi:hypothetical protein
LMFYVYGPKVSSSLVLAIRLEFLDKYRISS